MMAELFRRWRWALVLGALLAAGLVYAFWPTPAPVDVARVTRGPMTIGVTDDGVTRARDLFVVTAPVSGYMSRLELEVGDPVSRGTILTRMTGKPSTPLDPRSGAQLRALLAAARADAAGAGAALAQSRRDLARAEEVARRGFLSRARLEAARTQVRADEAVLARGQAEIARIEAQLSAPSGQPAGSGVPVRSPADGAVLSVLSESEGLLAEGAPLVAIGDPARIEAVIDLLSREAVRVRPGYPVEFSQWGGDAPLRGTVTRVEPAGTLKVSALGIEEQRVNVIVDFDAESSSAAARLGHGYQVDATIRLWSRKDALRVPIGALFRAPDGGWRVFVVEAGRARERAVRIGKVNAEYGEVVSGLAEGNRVILNPGNGIEDGGRVRPR